MINTVKSYSLTFYVTSGGLGSGSHNEIVKSIATAEYSCTRSSIFETFDPVTMAAHSLVISLGTKAVIPCHSPLLARDSFDGKAKANSEGSVQITTSNPLLVRAADRLTSTVNSALVADA